MRESELEYRRILQQQYKSGRITKKEYKKEKSDIFNLIYNKSRDNKSLTKIQKKK